MAVLLQAAIESPMPATAVAADEFAEYFVPTATSAATSRRSIQPPLAIQTPGSPPADDTTAATAIALLPTVSPLPMQAGAATPVRGSPAPLSADTVAELAVAAAEAAALRAVIKDLEHTAVVAAQAAENAQLRREMAHMQAMHEQRLQSDAVLRKALEAAIVPPTIMPPTSAIAPPSDAAALGKLLNTQLLALITPKLAAAHILDDQSSIEEVSDWAMRVLSAAAVVRGGKDFQLAAAIVLDLPGQHAIADSDSFLRRQVEEILTTCRNVADAGRDSEDDISVADSGSSSGRSSATSRDIFSGKNAAARRDLYNCVLECVSGGDIPHQDMATWSIIDKYSHSYFIAALADGGGRMLAAARKQATFLGSLAAALNIARHNTSTKLQRNFKILLGKTDYTNKDGNFIGVTPTSVMFQLIEDLDTRREAMRIIQEHVVALVCELAMQSMPIGAQGTGVATAFDSLKQEINVAATNDASIQEVQELIHTAIAKFGTNEPTGAMVVPEVTSPYLFGSKEVSAVSHAAEVKGGKGGTGKGRGKGTGDHRPLCLYGAQCKNYGTWTGCQDRHNDMDMTAMQVALGDKFISAAHRRRLLNEKNQTADMPTAMQTPVSQTAQQPAQQGPRNGDDIAVASMLQFAEHARHAKAMQALVKAAPVPRSAQQPPVPQPEPTAAADKLTEAAKFLAMLKKTQDEFDGSGTQQHSGAAVSDQRHFAISSLPIMQEASSVIPPGPATSHVIDGQYDVLLAENAQLRGVITILAACGHHAATSLSSSPLYEQPVSAATSLMPVACSDNVNAPVRINGYDPNIIMPPIIDAAFPPMRASHVATSTIRAIHVATGPKRKRRTNHMTSGGEWTGATMQTTMGVSRTVLQQARIESAARMAASKAYAAPLRPVPTFSAATHNRRLSQRPV